MVTENLCVFIELLAEADSYSFFIASAIDDRIAIVDLFCPCLCIFFNGFLMIRKVVDALFYLFLEAIVNDSEK
jgi:hypothetical protein